MRKLIVILGASHSTSNTISNQCWWIVKWSREWGEVEEYLKEGLDAVYDPDGGLGGGEVEVPDLESVPRQRVSHHDLELNRFRLHQLSILQRRCRLRVHEDPCKTPAASNT